MAFNPKRISLSLFLLFIVVIIPLPLIAQPNVPGCIVEIYAQQSGLRPNKLSFDSTGVLFAGNNAANVPIWRIGNGGSPIDLYGGPIYDPDAVVVDINGDIASLPKSVLVGSGAGGSNYSEIWEILPGQSTNLLFQAGNLVNPQDILIDHTGRLLIADAFRDAVLQSSGSAPTVLFSQSLPNELAVDDIGRIYTGSPTGIQIHANDGSLIDGSFVTGIDIWGLDFGPTSPPWYGLLYAVSFQGQLYSIDKIGTVTQIGTGFVNPLDITFGPDGALYVSDYGDDAIYRIMPDSDMEEALSIQAEDYDQGGQHVGYFDRTPGNAGGQYRQDDVDIWRSGPNNFYTGANATGEWLNYTIGVPYSGDYRLEIRLATPNSNRGLHVEFNGEDKTGPLTVPNTGWWASWQTLSTNVTLSAGQQIMRLVIDNGGFNIDQIALISSGDLSKVATPTVKPYGATFTDSVKVTLTTATAGATIYYTIDGSDPYTSGTRTQYSAPFTLTDDATVRAYAVKAGMSDSDEAIADFIKKAEAATTITIQAEDYDLGGQQVAYFDKTSGNAGGQYRQDDVDIWRCGPENYYTGANATGEWQNYTIDVPYNGNYRLTIRIGTPYDNRRLHVEFDGVNKTGSMIVPNTGWWTTWQTLSKNLTLDAGHQLLRLVVEYGGMNIDQISLVYLGN